MKENLQWNGKWFLDFWYENGQQKDFGSYQNGLMTGNWKGWYLMANKNMSPYENDLKSGFWKYWTDQGILKDQENYKIVVESSEISKEKYRNRINMATQNHLTKLKVSLSLKVPITKANRMDYGNTTSVERYQIEN